MENLRDLHNLVNQLTDHELIEFYNYLTTQFVSKYDSLYLHPDVPITQTVNHGNYMDYLVSIGNHEGCRILEIGSREVTGKSDARERFSKAEYIGFDYYPGDNVDVWGDAHKLSSYFSEPFDIIYSSAVFEHLAMPWVVAYEVAKCLKVNGIIFIETHFSFSSHERPSNFFQFSDMALKVLFSSELGFECIEAGMFNPIIGRFSSLAIDYLQYKPVTGLYCHSNFLGKKIRDISSCPDWQALDPAKLVEGSQYPLPRQASGQKSISLAIFPNWSLWNKVDDLRKEFLEIITILDSYSSNFRFNLWIHADELMIEEISELISSWIFEALESEDCLGAFSDNTEIYFLDFVRSGTDDQANKLDFRVVLDTEDLLAVSALPVAGVPISNLQAYCSQHV